MKTDQRCWSREEGWSGNTTSGNLKDAQLVVLFGHPSNLKNESEKHALIAATTATSTEN